MQKIFFATRFSFFVSRMAGYHLLDSNVIGGDFLLTRFRGNRSSLFFMQRRFMFNYTKYFFNSLATTRSIKTHVSFDRLNYTSYENGKNLALILSRLPSEKDYSSLNEQNLNIVFLVMSSQVTDIQQISFTQGWEEQKKILLQNLKSVQKGQWERGEKVVKEKDTLETKLMEILVTSLEKQGVSEKLIQSFFDTPQNGSSTESIFKLVENYLQFTALKEKMDSKEELDPISHGLSIDGKTPDGAIRKNGELSKIIDFALKKGDQEINDVCKQEVYTELAKKLGCSYETVKDQSGGFIDTQSRPVSDLKLSASLFEEDIRNLKERAESKRKYYKDKYDKDFGKSMRETMKAKGVSEHDEIQKINKINKKNASDL